LGEPQPSFLGPSYVRQHLRGPDLGHARLGRVAQLVKEVAGGLEALDGFEEVAPLAGQELLARVEDFFGSDELCGLVPA
jgi:hypothetical protein